MRDIEFRVWDNKKRKWLSDCMVSMNVRGVYDFSHDSNLRYNYKEDVEVSQFTGVYDCKGVKIFEGDEVVLRYSFKDEVFKKGVIKYGQKNIGSNGFEYNNNIYGFYPDTNNSDLEYLYSSFVEGRVEVVGNIYEI